MNLSRVQMFGQFYLVVSILYVTQFVDIDAALKIQSETLVFPQKELVFGHESYDSGKLTYAYCDKNDKSRERKCTLVREKMPYSNDNYICNITIKLDHRQGVSEADADRLSVMPFGKNKAILYQAERGSEANVKINTINLDDCKVTGTEISVTNLRKNPVYAVIMTPYEESYDIIYKNSHICGARGRCKITIASDGKIIGGPANTTQTPVFLTYFPNVVAVDPKSRDRGTFYMEPVQNRFMEYDIVIHKPDGSKTSLGKHKAHVPILKSASNNFLSTCYKENITKYNCIQYNNNGNKKFEMDPVSSFNKTDVTFIYNLPNGGLLTLAGKCDKRYCEINDIQFLVMKISPTGKLVGTLNIGALEFDSNTEGIKITASFHIDKDNNYCLSIAKYRNASRKDKTSATIEASTWYFTDQDFSQST